MSKFSLQGMSLLATQYLFARFSYSMVFCNKVNCVGVQDRQGNQDCLYTETLLSPPLKK